MTQVNLKGTVPLNFRELSPSASNFDVIIIGAGAAGLMTAIQAAQGGLRVLLLEGQKKVGAKILMSGGTRCNVTNKAVSEKDFNSEEIICVRNILRSFNKTDTIRFLKSWALNWSLKALANIFLPLIQAKPSWTH